MGQSLLTTPATRADHGALASSQEARASDGKRTWRSRRVGARASAAAAGAAGVLLLSGCGVSLLQGSGPGEDEREVSARSGAFTVVVPKDYGDVDVSGQPETIEVAVQRGDSEQIILSRFEGATTAEREGLHTVTGNTAQFGLACSPLDETLGGTKAWSCTGDDQGTAMEKVYATLSDGDSSALVLVQGPEGPTRELAEDVIESVDWR